MNMNDNTHHPIDHLRELFAELTYGVVEKHAVQPLKRIAKSKRGVCSEAAYYLAHNAKEAGFKYDFIATQHKVGTYSAGHRSVIVRDFDKHYLFSHSISLRVAGEEVNGRNGALAKLYNLSKKHDISMMHHMFVNLDSEYEGWNESHVDLTALDYRIGGRLCDQMDRIIGFR